MNVTYWRDLCSDLFGKDAAKLLAKNLRTIGSEQKNGKVIYVNSVEDPWLGVSVLPAEKPSEISFVDKLGGQLFQRQSLIEKPVDHSPVDKSAGSESVILECVDCGHCRDLSPPKKTDHEDLVKQRQKILQWVDAYVKKAI